MYIRRNGSVQQDVPVLEILGIWTGEQVFLEGVTALDERSRDWGLVDVVRHGGCYLDML